MPAKSAAESQLDLDFPGVHGFKISSSRLFFKVFHGRAAINVYHFY
jgi:hypothetical protein